MPDKSLVIQLLERALLSGLTPEEACVDHPEFLDEVRVRLGRVERLKWELDELFPEAKSEAESTKSEMTPLSRVALPQIPGHEVEAVLGRGGMGVVYQARHIRLNRRVAIKMLLSGAYAAPQELARFRREAEALAELAHPNVVLVHEAGELDGLPYFTMELVQGGNLAEKLAGVPQPADKAVTLMATLARAVQAAHDRGIVHRDLKPANILLSNDGTPKITDFGLAHRLDPGTGITRTGARLGTPSYMAPEQAAGKATGPPVDVYALGAILYELLTGRPPFRAETAIETERQVIAEEPAPPSKLNARVPRDLETICLKCLQKDPQRRYHSATALADDLGRFQRGESILARRTGTIERMFKWVRRHKWRTILAAFLCFVATLSLAGGWWLITERATISRAAKEDLEEAEQALDRSSWVEARNAAERARVKLIGRGFTALHNRLERVDRNLELAKRLDEVQTKYVESAGRGEEKGFDSAQADRDYEKIFQEVGLGSPDEPPEVIADRIRETGIRRAIVGALDCWAAYSRNIVRVRWIAAIAQAADADSKSGWRDRVRAQYHVKNLPALEELARTAPLDAQSIPLHLALASRIQSYGGDEVPFLIRIQSEHPDDFWATFLLATALDRHHHPDAFAYYKAALTFRPHSLAALNNLGVCLFDQGRIAEVHEHRLKILNLFPASDLVHYNLALSYRDRGQVELAAEHCREAIRLNPRYADAYAELGSVLYEQGQFQDARNMARKSLELSNQNRSKRQPEDKLDPYIVEKNIRMSQLAMRIIENSENQLALEPRLDGILKDKGMFKSDEVIWIAHLCVRKKMLTNAVYLYSIALASDIGLRDGHLYPAAHTAVQAGLGLGLNPSPDQEKRKQLRNQALAWMRLARDIWKKRYLTGNETDRRDTRRCFGTWLTDVRLIAVRDGTMETLSSEERRDWSAFWLSLKQMSSGELPSVEDARELTKKGEWKLAAKKFEELAELNMVDLGQEWFSYAAVQLLANDFEGYRTIRTRLLEHTPGTTSVRRFHVARTVTLAPGPSDKMTRAMLIANAKLQSENELKLSPNEFWSLIEGAALMHRAGRSQEAIGILRHCLTIESKLDAQVMIWLWLSLAYHEVGQVDMAMDRLNMAAKVLDEWQIKFRNTLPNFADLKVIDLHNWLEALVLRNEVERLIKSKKSAEGP